MFVKWCLKPKNKDKISVENPCFVSVLRVTPKGPQIVDSTSYWYLLKCSAPQLGKSFFLLFRGKRKYRSIFKIENSSIIGICVGSKYVPEAIFELEILAHFDTVILYRKKLWFQHFLTNGVFDFIHEKYFKNK